MNYLTHPDGPDSPAALHSEAVGDAIAEAVAPHQARAERLQRLLYIACLRLRNKSRRIQAETGGIAVPVNALEHMTLSDLRNDIGRRVECVNDIAESLWSGEDDLAAFLEEVTR